ncbi:hypothetical protein KP509_16G034400 [Ceratopteris richardii]|nr:hypothetical protein KP509_16G034400 [Ceratopteris richardii]
MRTCYDLCEGTSWNLRLVTSRTQLAFTGSYVKYSRPSVHGIIVHFKRGCHLKRVYSRKKRQSSKSTLRWSSFSKEQPTSAEFQNPMPSIPNEDEAFVSASSDQKKQSPSSFLLFLAGARDVFKGDHLGVEIAAIAVPSLLALTADPIASLVDTAYIGRLGSVELAAVGVSIAVFNLVSKLLNFPVLNLTTSFVAEAALKPEYAEDQISVLDTVSSARNRTNRTQKIVIPAVSTALVVGSALGILELVVMMLGARPILELMGVSMSSNMRIPAEQYLSLRAVGAPAVVVSLAVQGVFRGFKDTRTPLYAIVLENVINTILVPILTFTFGYGVSGAAVATVISQYVMALVLLLKMSRKVELLPPSLRDLDFSRFLSNGGLLLARSAAVMVTMTLATSEAARQGAIPMAAHQICMQIWLATSLLSDAIALAGQTIIASALAKGDHDLAKAAVFRTLQMGLVFGFLLFLVLSLSLSSLSTIFTNDTLVLEFLAKGIPFVAATQPINSIAFVFDGIHFGALDFVYAAQSMILIAVVASAFMLVVAPVWGFSGIWIGLTILMVLRMLAGILRIGTASGPWRFLK